MNINQYTQFLSSDNKYSYTLYVLANMYDVRFYDYLIN